MCDIKVSVTPELQCQSWCLNTYSIISHGLSSVFFLLVSPLSLWYHPGKCAWTPLHVSVCWENRLVFWVATAIQQVLRRAVHHVCCHWMYVYGSVLAAGFVPKYAAVLGRALASRDGRLGPSQHLILPIACGWPWQGTWSGVRCHRSGVTPAGTLEQTVRSANPYPFLDSGALRALEIEAMHDQARFGRV